MGCLSPTSKDLTKRRRVKTLSICLSASLLHSPLITGNVCNEKQLAKDWAKFRITLSAWGEWQLSIGHTPEKAEEEVETAFRVSGCGGASELKGSSYQGWAWKQKQTLSHPGTFISTVVWIGASSPQPMWSHWFSTNTVNTILCRFWKNCLERGKASGIVTNSPRVKVWDSEAELASLL